MLRPMLSFRGGVKFELLRTIVDEKPMSIHTPFMLKSTFEERFKTNFTFILPKIS